MNILALDTATDVLSAAVRTAGGLWYREVDAGLRHSELFLDLLQGLLQDAGLAPGDLDLAACMKGPGSFTGLRIGFAAVKGLSLAWGIPVAAVPTLDCMAAPAAHWPGLVAPMIDARQGHFFIAYYRGGERVSEYLDIPREDVDPGALLCGPVVARRGYARELLALAEKYATLSPLPAEGEEAGPLYLRKSDAELKKGC